MKLTVHVTRAESGYYLFRPYHLEARWDDDAEKIWTRKTED